MGNAMAVETSVRSVRSSLWQALVGFFTARDTGWRAFRAYVPVTDVDGNQIRGFLMRRRVAGAWQYRPATEEENEDAIQQGAW